MCDLFEVMLKDQPVAAVTAYVSAADGADAYKTATILEIVSRKL